MSGMGRAGEAEVDLQVIRGAREHYSWANLRARSVVVKVEQQCMALDHMGDHITGESSGELV